MKQISKLKLNNIIYEISLGYNSIINFNSIDQINPTDWSEVEILSSKEKNSNIFNKISIMFKNIRYLYSIIGSGFSPTNTVSDAVNKELPTHSHSVSQLPVSKTQINSSQYIPASSLIFSMNNQLTELQNQVNSIPRLKTFTITANVDQQMISLPISEYNNILSFEAYKDDVQIECIVKKTKTVWELYSMKLVQGLINTGLGPEKGATFTIIYI